MDLTAATDGARTSLAALSQGLRRIGESRLALDDTRGWMQGRTMYGGASSFVAYAAAQALLPGLPPLRSAHVAFIAPVGERLEAEAHVLRAGRSVHHVETTLTCEGQPVHRALWLFGSARPNNGSVPAPRLAHLVQPEHCPEVTWSAEAPAFAEQFELRSAEAQGDDASAMVRRWVRLHERAGLDRMGEIVAVGDTLPPGAIRAMERKGPISSINWALTMLGEAPSTRDGWWLLETHSNHLAAGFGSETLRMWNTDGVEVMRGLQSVAVFG